MIAAATRVLRPRAEVDTTTLGALGEDVERFDPDLVICSRPNTVDPGGRLAWVELPIDPTRPTRICIGGRYSESTNPTLDVLITVIEEVEQLIETGEYSRGC